MDKKKILNELAKFPSDESKAVWLLSQVEKLESDYQEFQDIIHDKTEKIISEVLRDDLDISEDLERWATLGRNWENWIQRFKGRIIVDEGIADGQAKKLLKAAKFTIENLRREISSTKRDTVQTLADMKTMKRKIYIHEQIEKLKTDSQKRKARNLCEGANSMYKIDQIIREVKNHAKQKQRI